MIYLAKILLVFCSRYGSTGDIILKIAQTLRKSGYDLTIRNLKGLEKGEMPDLKDFDGIIIGTGIKMNHWTKEVHKFFSVYENELKSTNIPLAVFVTSGKAINPANYDLIKNLYVDEKIKRKGYNVILTEVFAGVLNLTAQSPFNWFERRIVLAMRSEIPQIQPKMKNDFREWKKIVTFTNTFLNQLEQNNCQISNS